MRIRWKLTTSHVETYHANIMDFELEQVRDLRNCHDILKSNSMSMSRQKAGSEWHPHLPSYVSEPTNTKPNISITESHVEDLNLINEH